MARLRHGNGVVVSVPDEKVDGLLSVGFTREEEKKPAGKSSSSSKSSK